MDVNEPYKGLTIDVSGANQAITAANKIIAIYCNASGVIFAQLRGDSGLRRWNVTAGQVLFGDFSIIGNGAAGTTLLVAGDMVGLYSADE